MTIRLKPFNKQSKEFIQSVKNMNHLLQFKISLNENNQEICTQENSQNKTVKDIIQYMSNKWQIRKSRILLRICRSPADLVKLDINHLDTYTKKSDNKLIDLIGNDIKNQD